jgi:hypothetical protein
MLDALLSRERKTSFFDSRACDHPREVLSDNRPMLESVSRSTANNPNILKHRVPVD